MVILLDGIRRSHTLLDLIDYKTHIISSKLLEFFRMFQYIRAAVPATATYLIKEAQNIIGRANRFFMGETNHFAIHLIAKQALIYILPKTKLTYLNYNVIKTSG